MSQPHDVHDQRLHATCVTFGPHGVLLLGASGSGKSDLALRLISLPCRLPAAGADDPSAPILASLVADDQVLLSARMGQLFARAPAVLAGKLEVRGLGIVALPAVAETTVALAVELLPPGTVERMPDGDATTTIAGVPVPILRVAPFEVSAPIKVVLALARLNPNFLGMRSSKE